MKFVLVILFAISSNIDNIGVAAAYGIRKVRIGFQINLLIACTTSLLTYLAIILGNKLESLLPEVIGRYAGPLVIIAIGIWMIIQGRACYPDKPNMKFILPKGSDPEDAHLDEGVGWKEGGLLAAALSINNTAGGVGMGLSGFNPVLTTALVFIFSIVSIIAGWTSGRKAAFLTGDKGELVAGAMLIIIAVAEMLM